MSFTPIYISVYCGFLLVSLCQLDSPVLFWTGGDNEPLLAICNPPLDCLHQIMHYNHSPTNLSGMPIDKTQRMRFAC